MECSRALAYAFLLLGPACGGPEIPAPAAPAAVAPRAAPSPVPAVGPDAAPDMPSGEAARRIAEYASRVEPVIDAFSNYAPLLTPDRKQLLFSSDRDGLPQLYIADAEKPDAPVTRIRTPERVVGGESFDGKTILFRSDKGADENWSIFRVGLDGSGLTELTPGEKLQRDRPVAPASNPTTIFFSARDQTRPEPTIFAIDLEARSAPREVYRDEVQGSLLDVSPDGKLGLFRRTPRRTDVTLLVVDLEAGTARPLYPTDGQVRISDAAFSADGKRVFLSTDNGGEESFVLALDTATGKEEARYAETSPPTAQVTAIQVSKHGNLIAIAVDAGHRDHLRLLDARSLKVRRTLELPTGSGGLGEFSHDGRRLTLTWSTPDRPYEVYVARTANGKLAPLRAELRPSLASLPGIDTINDEVPSFDGSKVPVILYLPAGANGKLPVIVNYHGGPAGVAKVSWNTDARFYTSIGYAYVDPNVRGSSGYGRAYEMADNGPRRLDAFKDVEAVGRWVAEQPWADRDRLVMHGGSYGGYTVLIGLTRMPDLWRAGVDLVGVVNLRTFLRSTTGTIRELFKLEFGDLDRDAEFLDSISPLRDVDKIVDPLFVYAGANDPRVPRTESDQIVVALRQRGVPVEYMVKNNEGHSLDRRENQIEFYARVALFLETHLGPPP